MKEDNFAIYYRGFDSNYPNLGNNKSFLWVTDNIQYAQLYSKSDNSLAEIKIYFNELNYAEEYEIEELLLDFDYDLYDPNQHLCQELISHGYNAFLIHNSQQDDLLCIIDKSLIQSITIIE